MRDTNVHRDVDEGAGTELLILVGELKAHLERPSCLVDRRGEEDHLGFERRFHALDRQARRGAEP